MEVELNIRVGQARPAPPKKQTFWKLNTSLLVNEDFQSQFQTLYDKLTRLIVEYEDHADWWEILAKPTIASFCKDFSSKLSKERKSTKLFLYASLRIYLKEENWMELARVKEELRRMLQYEMAGVKIRSRQGEYGEEERGSIYHYNKEKKRAGSNNLKKMKFKNQEGVEEITEDISKIEEIAVSFYDALFNGRHDKDLVDTGMPFQPTDVHLEEFLDQLPTISEESKPKLIRELTLEELESIVKSCPNGKSPGMDGLPY